ncbi:uncharacterized protein LOC125957241 [Anopheles darlingi]|uniref:uncharacterized protein LOC125957241 n=1 Tax=Anopheles darlingi TaxID=43151 RepID=UPI00210049A0|nr:uncharacterized protein LOC125957241 [Anopheles darlingi]
MYRPCGGRLLALLLLAVGTVVHCEAPYSTTSHVTIIGKYAAAATLCYTTSIKSDVFSFVPISRTVTFTPKKSVSFVKISSKASPLLGTRLVMGGLGSSPASPISVALTTDFGGRLNAEIEAFC